jgi:DeoR/GlpR family transcriptional regulator of sugar metabolism
MGSSAEKMIKSYHVDTAIISCKGLDTELGATDSNENDSLIKQAMLSSAERKILALDTEKFDKKAFIHPKTISAYNYFQKELGW